MPWRDLPERFGNPIRIHMRFSRWAKSGVWKRLFEMLATDADNEYAMIDSTIVRAHQHSAGAQKVGEDQAIGRSKGGLSTKIHAMVDALGNPVSFFLTPGQAHDLDGADAEIGSPRRAIASDTNGQREHRRLLRCPPAA